MKFKFATPHFYLTPCPQANPTPPGLGRGCQRWWLVEGGQLPAGIWARTPAWDLPWGCWGARRCQHTVLPVPGSLRGPCLHVQVALLATITFFFFPGETEHEAMSFKVFIPDTHFPLPTH